MEIIKKFNATFVNFTDEDDVLTIGVADDAKDPDNFIIIGRYDEDDLSVNQCIGLQTDSTPYEVSDALEEVILDNTKLILKIKDDAVNKIGAKTIETVFSKQVDTHKLKYSLKLMLEGSDIKIINM